MSLSPEAVNQSVLVAALFLVMISVPKLVALTALYVYRVLIFLHLGSVMQSKPMQRLTKEGTAEILKKDADDPRLKVKTTAEALGNFYGSIRDPMIEALTAARALDVEKRNGFNGPLLTTKET